MVSGSRILDDDRKIVTVQVDSTGRWEGWYVHEYTSRMQRPLAGDEADSIEAYEEPGLHGPMPYLEIKQNGQVVERSPASKYRILYLREGS